MPSMNASYRFRCNAPHGCRQRLAQWVLGCAARLDGARIVMAVEVVTHPTLEPDELRRALMAGQDLSVRLIREAVNAQAIDLLMQQAYPDLFEQE